MRSGMLSRAATVLLVLGLALGTFVPARAARPQSPQVTVSVWTAYTRGLLEAFNHLTSEFEKRYPNIKIDEVSSANYTALLQKEQSAVFAHNTPVLGQAYEAWTQQFLKSSAVEPLDSYIKGKNGLSSKDIKDFFGPMWKDGYLGGKFYMMPFSKSDIVLFFNGPMLRSHGIKTPPKTWTEYAADCKKLTGHGQWCSTLQFDPSFFYVWEYEWGNKVLDKHNRAAFANSKGAAPIQFFANLVKKKYVVASQTLNYQDEADIDAGKTAFMIGTSAGLTYILAGAKPGVAVGESVFPAGPKHQYTEMFGAPMIMFKNASSQEKSAGWTFLKWLTEPAQTAYWSEHTGYVPVRQSALKMGTMRSYYAHNPQQRAAVTQLNHALVEPALAGWTKAQSDIRTTMLAALSGSQSPMQAVKSAAAQVNSDLSS